MPGIFKLNQDNTVVLTPEAKDLCQMLSKLDYKNFLYIILVYDTMDSPYREMPVEDRRRIAKNRIWGKDADDPEDNPRIHDAMAEMQSICYNSNRVIKENLLVKLSMLNQELLAASTSQVKSVIDAIRSVEDMIEEIDDKIDKDVDRVTLKAGKTLSLVEMFIRNREKYSEKMRQYGIGNG